MMNQVQIQLPTATTSLNGYHHHHLNGHTHSNSHRNNIASYIPQQTSTNGVINYQNNVTHFQHQISNPSSNHSSPKVTYQQFATSSNATTTIIQNPINTNPVTPANPLTNSTVNISQSPSPLPTQSVTPKIDIEPVTPSQLKNSQNAQPENGHNKTCCDINEENTENVNENVTPSAPTPTDDGKAHCNQEEDGKVTKPSIVKDDKKGFDIDALQEEIENMEEEEKRKLLIDNLYKLTKEKQPMLVSKITGMIMHQQSNETLLSLLIDPNHEKLNKKIDEAVDILTKDEEKGGEYYVICNGISNCNNTEEKLKYFRNKLYPKVEEYVCVKSLADELTELLLSLDICELFVILDPNEGEALKQRMDQAIRYYVSKNKDKNNNNNNSQQKAQTNGQQNPLQQTQTMPQTPPQTPPQQPQQPQQTQQQIQRTQHANNGSTGTSLCHSHQSVVQHQHIGNQQQQTVLFNGYQHTNGHQIQQQQPITNGVNQVQLQQSNLLNGHNQQQTNVHHNHLIQQRQQQMQQVINHSQNGYVQQQLQQQHLNAQQLQRIQQLRQAQQLQAQQQMKVQQQQQLQAHQLRLQQQQNMNVNVVRNGHHLAHQVNGYHAHQTAQHHIQHVQHVQRAANGHVYQNGHVHHQRLHSNIK